MPAHTSIEKRRPTMDTAIHRNRLGDAEDVVLLRFSDVHLDGALRLSQEMGWPYRREDWAFALTLGQGFVLERGGALIGTSGWFPYGETHATAGLIIVSRAAQGRGYGAKLMDALLEAARPRTILLNATAEGRALYERRGFRAVGVIHQHQGVARTGGEAPSPDLVRRMGPADAGAVARLDREATGLDRGPLLRRLADVGEGHVLLGNGAPVGYAVSRLFGRGHVIGPVVAPSAAEARILVSAALARLEDHFVRIDTAAIAELGPWLEETGLARVSDALTMALGPLPVTGPARVFALANQSLH